MGPGSIAAVLINKRPECERDCLVPITRDQRRRGDLATGRRRIRDHSPLGDYSLLMPDRGNLGELPNPSAPIFQEEQVFRSECAGPASTTLPHPTPGVIRRFGRGRTEKLPCRPLDCGGGVFGSD